MKHIFKTLATAGNAMVEAAVSALHAMQSRESKSDRARQGHIGITCRADTKAQIKKKSLQDRARMLLGRWVNIGSQRPQGGHYLNAEYRERAWNRYLRWVRSQKYDREMTRESIRRTGDCPRHIMDKAYL